MQKRRRIQGEQVAFGRGRSTQHGTTRDPTENVLDLVYMQVNRIDDLRELNRIHSRELLASELHRVDEITAMRSHYEGLLASAEAKRIDAIRAVDVNAVAVASERAGASATVLANQLVASADALRNLVASTATATAQQQAQLTTQFNDRIAQLEKASYEGKGRSAYVDPMMVELVSEMKQINASQQLTSGSKQGQVATWAAIGLGITILVGLLVIGAKLSTVDVPRVVYEPVPAATAKVK